VVEPICWKLCFPLGEKKVSSPIPPKKSFCLSAEEIMMSYKTFLFLVVSITTVIALAYNAVCSAAPAEASLSVVVLGQESANNSEPGLGERVKRLFRWLKEDEPDGHTGHNHDLPGAKPAQVSGTPTQPPKPLTATEVKQSLEPQKVQEQRRSSHNTSRRNSHSVSTTNNIEAQDTDSSDSDESIFDRLSEMRKRVFAAQSADLVTPQAATSYSVQRTSAHSVQNNNQELILARKRQSEQQAERSQETPQVVPSENRTANDPFLDRPAVAVTTATPQTNQTVSDSMDVEPLRIPSPSALATSTSEEKLRQEADSSAPTNLLRQERKPSPPAPSEPMTAALKVNGTSSVIAEPDKRSVISPRLELETEGPQKTIVGRESVYRIRVINTGNAPAEQVVLSVEIPQWIEIRQSNVSNGKTSVVPRDETNEISDLSWSITRIEPGAEELLILHLVPMKRKSVDLKIKYDFYRPTAVAKIDVQEPVLEMELQGPDDVQWGSEVLYTLLVRNMGNGDAEDVKLELLQTNSDMKACTLDLLEAGKEQGIDVKVWTGKQDYIDINIQASGRYDLKADVKKRIKVLRPNLELTVNSPGIQFIGVPAEFTIKVQNNGAAPAKDFEVQANIPLGTQYVSSSNGGEQTTPNQVVWKVAALSVGEIFAASVVCEPKREGDCSLETLVSDQGGVLATCIGSFTAEAVVELKLDVENPQGPIEVGKEAAYTVNVKNLGTKAAENVEVTMAFSEGMEPTAVEGASASYDKGFVIFNKIPTIPAGQSIQLKVNAKAETPANHQIRTDVVCSAASIHLVNEHAQYYYQKQAGKTSTTVLAE
jgi:uncharacterized repeat protein (TIGR01451 family)